MSNKQSKIRAICEKGKEKALTEEYICNLNDQKVENFFKIFSTLLNKRPEELNESAKTAQDSEDGAIDTIIFAASRLSKLLKCDIDSLKLPKLFKKSLKILRAFVDFIRVKKTIEALQDATSKDGDA